MLSLSLTLLLPSAAYSPGPWAPVSSFPAPPLTWVTWAAEPGGGRWERSCPTGLFVDLTVIAHSPSESTLSPPYPCTHLLPPLHPSLWPPQGQGSGRALSARPSVRGCTPVVFLRLSVHCCHLLPFVTVAADPYEELPASPFSPSPLSYQALPSPFLEVTPDLLAPPSTQLPCSSHLRGCLVAPPLP